MANLSRNDRRLKRHARVRKNVFGTPEKPRMCVFRSNSNISVQIIDDVNHKTLVSASSIDKDLKAEIGYGGNKEAARMSGVNTNKIMFLAYLNMAFLTSITTMMILGRMTAANSTAGTNFEMDAISACVVGGVSASGGAGSVFGMVIGATLIGVINLGMSLMGIDANWQKVVKGVVLLGAVAFDILGKKNKK